MTNKLAFSGLLLAAALTTSAQAQHAVPTTTPGTQRMPMNRRPIKANNPNQPQAGGYRAAEPATRARRMTDDLTKQLNLDDATAQKVYAIALNRDRTVDAIQTGSDDNRTRNTKLKANADDFNIKMQGVLTADQFEKFRALKHHKGGKGGMTPPDSSRGNH